MKKIIILWICVLWAHYVNAQSKTISLDTLPYLTHDTSINNFMLHWIGKPYKLGGKTEKGIDCSQFTKRFYKDVYNKQLENVAYRQWNQTLRVKRDSLQIGHIVFFRSRQSPSGWHCGIYLGETMFIHAANRYEGVKISFLLEPRYKNAYRGAGKLKQ